MDADTCGREREPLPIVMVAFDYDPLALGYIKSLARPGGNITGLFVQQIELAMKRLQLIQEAFPKAQAATVFWDRLSVDQWQAVQKLQTLWPASGTASPWRSDEIFARISQLIAKRRSNNTAPPHISRVSVRPHK